MIDFVLIAHLCNACVYNENCLLMMDFPVHDCSEFDDGYDGPVYPDGDAFWERQRIMFGELNESINPHI